jgi:hypothetical protein
MYIVHYWEEGAKCSENCGKSGEWAWRILTAFFDESHRTWLEWEK